MEVVASLSQGRTAAAQCGLFTHKSVPVIFEPPCICCSFSAQNMKSVRPKVLLIQYSRTTDSRALENYFSKSFKLFMTHP